MIEIFIAFGAGFISFLSPCVLPLIPGYISFISGQSLNDILVCLRCFLKMKFTIDVCEHNDEIKKMIFSKLNV